MLGPDDSRWKMSAPDKPTPDTRTCSNCRYLTFTPGDFLGCADTASHDVDPAVQPTACCGRFQISFEAAKLLAVRNSTPGFEPWELAMHGHLAPRKAIPN